jgi:hypothetical protein
MGLYPLIPKYLSLMKLLIPLVVALLMPLFAFAQPQDNPVASHYLAEGQGYPAWTDRIAWHRVIDMSVYSNGATAFERFENARDELHAQGGGVLYYPAGVYDFTDMPADGPNGRGLMLRSGVAIRGATPQGDRWARPHAGSGNNADGVLDLPTQFVFGFTPRTGTGVTPTGETPRDWNFVGLIPTGDEALSEVSDIGVAWIHFVGASVFWGFELDWNGTTPYSSSGAWKAALVKTAWQSRVADGTFPWDYFAGSGGSRSVVGNGAGPGRLVFGCVFEDSAPVNNVVMEGRASGGKNFGPNGYWLQKFGARVQVYGSEVFIGNNVFPKSLRSFLYRQTVGHNPNQSTDANQWTNQEQTVLFDYNYGTAVDVNKEFLNPYVGKNTVYFLPGVVIQDNFVFNHGRKGFNPSGKWMTLRNNQNQRLVLSGVVPSNYGPASGQAHYLTLDGYVQCKPGGAGDISDSLSRAFDVAGGPAWIDSNTYGPARSSVANDGEGILCQAHGGTQLYSWAVTRNTGPEYMAGYDVHHYGSLWSWNHAGGKNIGNVKAGSLYDFAVAGNASGVVKTDGTHMDPGGVLTSCPGSGLSAPVWVDAVLQGDAVRITYLDSSNGEIGFRIDRKVGSGNWTTIAYRPRQSARSALNPEEWVDYLAPRGEELLYRVAAINCSDDDTAISLADSSVMLPSLEEPETPRYETVNYVDLHPYVGNWAQGYENRLADLAYARTPWNVLGGNADSDDGKRVFTALLTEMWKVRDNPVALKNLIDTTGDNRVRSTHAGSFYKPFSVPPLTHYYHVAKNIMEQSQKDYILNRRNSATEWGYITRRDGYMDPLYNPSLFNSENFNWMARLGGYLWVQEFPDFDLGSGKGMSRAFFQTHLNNLTRALYNVGRVEWNSNNYWGHSFIAILPLYEFAPDAETKAQAKALLDWMVIEAAVHHLDGFQVGADVRAKTNAHLPFTGGVWSFAYLYFIDDNYHPTYDVASVQNRIGVDYVGLVHWSSYRPPQVAIDMAQRKYGLPVEILSAKPFYYLDHENYKDWAGDTVKSRRFEFETVWQDENYLMASLATYRPDRNASIPSQSGFFTEQGLWRLGVKGIDNGALQITGNSGSGSTTNGRHPYEQIGQFRNMMMRIVKGSNQLWITVPNELSPEPADGNRLFINMGHGVYAAFVPHNHTTYSVGTPGVSHTQHFWNFNTAQFGGLILEVGTERDFGSYSNFKQSILQDAQLSVPGTDQLAYVSPLGYELRMQFMPTTTMLLNPGQVNNSGNALAERWWSPAGVVPRVWRDNVEVDFHTWNSYEVVEGPPIIHQEWGSGILRALAGNEGMEIRIDPVTAAPEFFRVNLLEGELNYSGPPDDTLPPGYSDWAAGLPSGQRGLFDTPFNDGVINLLRFALGGDASPGFQYPSFQSAPGSSYLYEVDLRKGVDVEVEFSQELQTWINSSLLNDVEFELVPVSSELDRLRVNPPASWQNSFMRLVFSQ